MAFHEGLARYFGGTEKNWDAAKVRVAIQRQADPNSIAAVLAESIFWYQYAWDARGNGYARTVTPAGWKLFRERLAGARNVLDESKGRAAANPLWYYAMLQIATDEGWREEDFDAVYEEALKRYPDFFIFYFAKARHLLPKWGGDMDNYDDFVNRTVQATRATDGVSMYARLYWSYDGAQVEGNLFAESRANWPRMKKGFEDLMARYPDSYWNLNSFASFACKARDRETFVTLIGRSVRTCSHLRGEATIRSTPARPFF